MQPRHGARQRGHHRAPLNGRARLASRSASAGAGPELAAQRAWAASRAGRGSSPRCQAGIVQSSSPGSSCGTSASGTVTLHAVVLRAGLEAVGERQRHPVQGQLVRVVLGRELLVAPPARRRATDSSSSGILRFGLLAPGLEALDRSSPIRARADRRTRAARPRPPACRSCAPCRAARDTSLEQLAVLRLKLAAALVLAAHQRMLEEHEPRPHRRDRRVVDAAILAAPASRTAWRARGPWRAPTSPTSAGRSSCA